MVDGHNLIPKIGLRLDFADDELQLIEILQEYSRRSRVTIEVFFDGAPAGQVVSRKFGLVTARFVSQSSSADAAIRQRLRKLGGDARNWTVVSTDREVLQSAKAVHARTQTAEEFAARVHALRAGQRKADAAARGRGEDGGLSGDELRDWLELFRKRA